MQIRAQRRRPLLPEQQSCATTRARGPNTHNKIGAKRKVLSLSTILLLFQFQQNIQSHISVCCIYAERIISFRRHHHHFILFNASSAFFCFFSISSSLENSFQASNWPIQLSCRLLLAALHTLSWRQVQLVIMLFPLKLPIAEIILTASPSAAAADVLVVSLSTS